MPRQLPGSSGGSRASAAGAVAALGTRTETRNSFTDGEAGVQSLRASGPATAARGHARAVANGAFSPSRYVARIDRRSGRELRAPIRPDELLVHAHRDRHPLQLAVQVLASRLVALTGSEWLVRRAVRGVDSLGSGLAAGLGALARSESAGRAARRLLGVAKSKDLLRLRGSRLCGRAAQARIESLRLQARAALAARDCARHLRILLTGATGFLGKEILVQAAEDPHVEEVVCLVRPQAIRHPRSGRLLGVVGPRRRGALLLRQLGIAGTTARKFRFVRGDVEKPRLGLGRREVARLRHRLTHVVHCAASVSFEASYEDSFRANVLGSRNALSLSLALQHARGSPFVSHLAIETSFVHGRAGRSQAPEGRLVFPAHFYNNFYELTKAMATLETERYMLERGLRVIQLMPSIVVGHSRTGNNRGDTKVVNAPVNAFGRAKQVLSRLAAGGWADRLRARALAPLATAFPADLTAELNLVPVDRVAAGVLAALTAPLAIGARIQLATDHRISAAAVARVVHEELGVRVHLFDPTLSRTGLALCLKPLLEALGETRLADCVERLAGVFGTYTEWGQPIHGVGNDVKILALPVLRPDTLLAFRMLCRHNAYVQEFGRVKRPDEVARRERLWEEALDSIELERGVAPATLPAVEFRRLLEQRIDLPHFRPAVRA
jgi:nucleoside-diphosphate-sugar epimerase